MRKWIGNPLASVGDQIKLTPTLFASLPYALNRSLDLDLFCGGSSARPRSTSHAHKMNSRSGIIIYAVSQYSLTNTKICFSRCLQSYCNIWLVCIICSWYWLNHVREWKSHMTWRRNICCLCFMRNMSM